MACSNDSSKSDHRSKLAEIPEAVDGNRDWTLNHGLKEQNERRGSAELAGVIPTVEKRNHTRGGSFNLNSRTTTALQLGTQ